jgi:hypothetical protein
MKQNKIVKRSVKHEFTPDETATLNVEFRQSFAELKSKEAEFDSVKASYKAKVTEAESRMERLNATLQAGFEYREKETVLIYDVKAGKKFFYLRDEWDAAEKSSIPAEPAIIEGMTQDDYQTELIQAEGEFDNRKEIQIFPATANDSGVLVVGEQGGKWFSALRVKIGGREIKERLDGEQSCSKLRSVQIERSLVRFEQWVTENLGKEEAKGFKNHIALVVAENAEKAE